MFKKILVTSIIIALISLSASPVCFAETITGKIYENNEPILYRNVTVYAPAVAENDNGYVGIMSTLTVTIQSSGSGKVFVDTLPLTQVDMQGSARLAVKVASALIENDLNCTADPGSFDYFFVVRTNAPIISGPSASAVMTAATVSLLENWEMDEKTVMTGMINPDGSIGHVGGIIQKIDSAYEVGAKRFLIPKGQGTYQETVSDTSTGNGWTKIQQKTVTRNVEDYVIDNNYNIEVIEVRNIDEVVKYFTGHTFTTFSSESSIKSEEYTDAFYTLASTLIKESEELYGESTELFNNTKESIPNKEWDWDTLQFNYYRNDVEDVLDEAEIYKEESEKWFERGMYYTSTTKSFLSLINSRYVYYTCNYFDTDEDSREEYLEGLIEEINELCMNKSNLARHTEISGFVSLQCVGAAQKRASESLDYLEGANNSFENDKYLSSLEYLARAKERSESVGWWLNLSGFFDETGDINTSEIDSLALEYIEEAEQTITYSSILLEEMGGSSSYLNDAYDKLDNAEEERDNGYPAAALFEALDSITRANLEIETIGVNTENEYKSKISWINETALSSIQKSIGYGMKPVISVCYYEYGDSLLEEEDFNYALFYYRFSGMIAGALTFSNASKDTISSRYEGVPEYNPPEGRLTDFLSASFLVAVFALGAVAGLGFGLVIGGITLSGGDKQKEDKKQEETKQVYKSYASGRRPPRSYNYPNNQTPRSIRDYYKKNK